MDGDDPDVLRFWTQPPTGRLSFDLPISPPPNAPTLCAVAWTPPSAYFPVFASSSAFPILEGTVIRQHSEVTLKPAPPAFRPPPPLFDAVPPAQPQKLAPRTINRTRVASLKVREAAGAAETAEDLASPPPPAAQIKTKPAARTVSASPSSGDEEDAEAEKVDDARRRLSARERASNRDAARRCRERKEAQLVEALRERDEARQALASLIATVNAAVAAASASLASMTPPDDPPAKRARR